MKKVVLGSILFISIFLLVFSYLKLDSIRNNTKHLEKEISNIEKKNKEVKSKHDKKNQELTREKEKSNSLIGELEIWEKAKEKLKKAL